MLDNFLLRGPGQTLNTSSLYRLPFGQIFVRGISTDLLVTCLERNSRRDLAAAE